MNRPPRRCVSLGAVALLFVAVGSAGIAAAESGEPIRLEYRAGSGCPDKAAFVRRIQARTARARLVEEGERARTFTVQLAAGEHPSGSVTVTDGDRSEGTRRIDADTCDDVADALALMVALALDPHALSALASSPPEPLPVVDAGTDAADASSPPPPLPPPPPTPSAAPEEDAGPPPSPARRDRHVSGGADFAVATGVTPTTLFAGAPYLGWRATRASLFGRLGPSVRASFLRAGTGTISTPGGTADFTWTVGRLDGCAMLWPDRPLRLGACERAEVGILDVGGEQIAGARTQHSPWFALDTLARLEWSFFGPLALDAALGPAFRITADHFYFLPGATAYQVPIVGFVGEAGVGVHFL